MKYKSGEKRLLESGSAASEAGGEREASFKGGFRVTYLSSSESEFTLRPSCDVLIPLSTQKTMVAAVIPSPTSTPSRSLMASCCQPAQ